MLIQRRYHGLDKKMLIYSRSIAGHTIFSTYCLKLLDKLYMY